MLLQPNAHGVERLADCDGKGACHCTCRGGREAFVVKRACWSRTTPSQWLLNAATQQLPGKSLEASNTPAMKSLAAGPSEKLPGSQAMISIYRGCKGGGYPVMPSQGDCTAVIGDALQ